MALKDLFNLKKHPFYQTANTKAWLAERDGIVIGRIMAIHNYTFNKYENNKIGHFGCFEVVNDLEVAKSLIEISSAYLKKQGMQSIQGPMNPGTNYECGILVDRFDDPPQIMMTYNPPYYEKLLYDLGFIKTMDLLAYNYKVDQELPKVILDIALRTENKAKVTYRNLNLKNWDQELETLFDIYNSAWESNWGFVPMSKDEFFHSAKDLKSIVDPNLIQFAMINNIEAGFIMALPDLNQVFKKIPSGKLSPIAIYKILTAKKQITRVRVITMGIKKEFRKIGLETLLYKNALIAIKKNPRITDIEMSWILEHNLEMNKPLIRMSGAPYKRYRLVEKAI
jgi:hypothetical protein